MTSDDQTPGPTAPEDDEKLSKLEVVGGVVGLLAFLAVVYKYSVRLQPWWPYVLSVLVVLLVAVAVYWIVKVRRRG